MITKLYEKLKKYIKENYKFILTLLISYIIFTFPLPYYIYTTGGIMDINDKVEIKNAYTNKGSLNFAYVSELRATLPTYLMSYIVPSWERVKIEEYKLNENETVEDVSFRDHIALEEANQSAIELAYTKAGKTHSIKERHHYVIYVSEESNTDLEVGDEIISVAGKEITSLDQYRQVIGQHDFGEVLDLVVKKDGKEKVKYITVIDMEGSKMTGISITTIYEYETLPEVTLNFSKAESGPSGGLMLTLAIYNKLIEEDITYGKKIVGTGTIDINGKVGSIGGVEYKLRGAAKEKADLFLVPKGDNYEECLKVKEEENLDIEIVPVETFDEALLALAKLKS